jgi:acetyl esterase/lipase
MKLAPRWVTLLIASLVLSTDAVQSAEAPQDPRVAEFFQLVKRHVQDPRRDREVTRRDDLVAGSRLDGSPLQVDLTLPRASAAGGQTVRPVVVLLHGGLPDEAPIRPSDWQGYRDWSAILADAGFAVVMFDHRLGYPERRLKEAAAEVAQVLDWIERNAATSGLDPQRIHVLSFSAGGLLVPELARSGRVAGFVLYYPLLGVAPGGPDFQATPNQAKEAMALAGVLDALHRRSTPILIVRAGADAVPGLLPLLDAALAEALRRDLDLELVNVAGVPHGFELTSESAVVTLWIDRTIDFLRRR